MSVCVFAFDLMYANGESLLDVPLRDRITKLHALFKEVCGMHV